MIRTLSFALTVALIAATPIPAADPKPENPEQAVLDALQAQIKALQADKVRLTMELDDCQKLVARYEAAICKDLVPIAKDVAALKALAEKGNLEQLGKDVAAIRKLMETPKEAVGPMPHETKTVTETRIESWKQPKTGEPTEKNIEDRKETKTTTPKKLP